jgi:thermolabile hemolysin
MKSPLPLAAWLLLFGPLVVPGQAAFTSLYVFGDGACTTTNGPGGPSYYERRYSNGRVWVEVLAQRQGLSYDADKNWSYFGHYSPDLVTNLSRFAAPPDAGTALFVVWVNDADFVYDVIHYAPYTTNNLAVWTSAINQSLTNHLRAIQTLYAKGARTLVMPNAVHITKVPYFVRLASADKKFVRQRIIDFNAAFAATLNQTMASLPGLVIHIPDIFTLLDDMVAEPADYGLTNALDDGFSIDALSDPLLLDKSFTGPGASYIFWDYMHPTAKAHAVIADYVQQLVAPVEIRNLTVLDGSNRLDLANVPIGRPGSLKGSTDFVNWVTDARVESTNALEVLFVRPAGAQRFYRLRFPLNWSWP